MTVLPQPSAFDPLGARLSLSRDMSHSDFDVACLTVRLGAIAANYREFQRRAGAGIAAGVVKADAYGLGMARIARTLAENKCDTFFVARAREGVALRPLVPKARIFVLDGAPADSVPALIANKLTPVLNSLADIAAWSAAARELRTTFDAAIHIDTGMNRLGLPAYELATLSAESETRLKNINTVLVMSHLACSDDATNPMNALQLDRFKTALAMLPTAPASLSSSGGALLGREYVFDMLRPGIGLYGGNPAKSGANPFAVAAVLTSRILQLRRVDSGETVGYGATFRVEREGKLATVGLGYADGVMRAIGNKGFGAIGGARVPVAGRVSMDLITYDVTGVPAPQLGAEIEIFGDTISLEEFAGWAGTANYEVITRLGSRVPRRYVEDLP
jgi:alanine racemase